MNRNGKDKGMNETKNGMILNLNDKGFGFIKPTNETGKKDIFFHASGLIDVEFNTLEPGMRVCYVEKEGKKGLMAADIVIDYFGYADRELDKKINKDKPKKYWKASQVI